MTTDFVVSAGPGQLRVGDVIHSENISAHDQSGMTGTSKNGCYFYEARIVGIVIGPATVQDWENYHSRLGIKPTIFDFSAHKISEFWFVRFD